MRELKPNDIGDFLGDRLTDERGTKHTVGNRVVVVGCYYKTADYLQVCAQTRFA